MKSIIGLLLVLMAPLAQAEVLSAANHGFEVQHSVSVKLEPETIWKVLIQPQRWWLAEHSWSGNAKNFSLDARAGGCFCEKLAQGSVSHMRVLYADKAKLLRLQGGLGPLQEQAVDGVMSWDLLMGKDGTQVTVTYRVHGYVSGGLDKWSAPVDQVIGAQLQSLVKQFAQ